MNKLLIIDTETTGLDPNIHSMLTFGAVVWADGGILDSIEMAVYERDPVIDQSAMKINQINLAAIRENGLSSSEMVTSLNDFVNKWFGTEKAVIVGHNVNFDIGFLKRIYKLANIDYDQYFSYRSLDTASIIRFLIISDVIKSINGASLDDALNYFGIEVSGRHTAINDAMVTAKLLNELIRVVKEKDEK